jgi:hypothetical protein
MAAKQGSIKAGAPVVQRCPECDSTRTVPIVFGLPTDALLARAGAGRVALGGCCVSQDDPDQHCQDCGREWQSARQPARAESTRPQS